MKNLILIPLLSMAALTGCSDNRIDEVESYILTVNTKTQGNTWKTLNKKLTHVYAHEGYIEITSKSDDVKIEEFLFNRGKCEIDNKSLMEILERKGYVKLNFGSRITMGFSCVGSDLIEIIIATELGDFTYDI